MYFELFVSEKDDDWYWHIIADNGQIIATAGQGYASKQGALHSIRLVKNNAAKSSIYDDYHDEWL